MSMILVQWRVRCLTDDRWEYLDLARGAPPPVACPVDAGHAIGAVEVERIYQEQRGALSWAANPTATQATSTAWTAMPPVLFPGSAELGPPARIRTISRVTRSGAQGQIRVYDRTNGVVLGGSPQFGAVLWATLVIPLSGVALGEAQWEVQQRRAVGQAGDAVQTSFVVVEW
jgi:hypothetical protein